MRPLKSHFRADALPTLDTVLKQTKEARVFRRAQAVREVVTGRHVNAVSATFRFANSALRKWVQRFAQHGPAGLAESSAFWAPAHSHRGNWKTPSNALLTTTPSSMVPVLRNGVVASSPPS